TVEDAALTLTRLKSEDEPAEKKKLVKQYDDLVNDGQKALIDLKHIVANNPDEQKKAENIEKVMNYGLQKLSECKQNLLEGNDFIAFGDMPKLFKVGYFVKAQVDDLGE